MDNTVDKSPAHAVFRRVLPMYAMSADPTTLRPPRAPFALPSVIGALALLALLASPVASDAKRKRPSPSPLKIVSVTPAPVPFIPGPGSSLTMSVIVDLPDNLDGAELIEVSSLISFPSKRSIRFLFDRQPLQGDAGETKTARKRFTLIWDGKDQHSRYVNPGTYVYHVRAKLMAEKDGGAKATMVSLFSRGTLDVADHASESDDET